MKPAFQHIWRYYLAHSLALLTLVGCGANGPVMGTGESEPQTSTATATGVSLAKTLAQVQAYPAPDGLPMFEQLRATLVSELETRGSAKFASTAPGGEGNIVSDIVMDNDTGVLSWTYVNTGDYNQDGEVNVSDITPIALYYGSTVGDADWVEAQVADGDKNGEVNMADIQQIVLNYWNRVSAYNIYTSPDIDDVPSGPGEPNGPGTVLRQTVNLAQANDTPGFKALSSLYMGVFDQNWYWVRPVDGRELGDASNAAQFVSSATKGEETLVTDLGINSGNAELTWTYANLGDYDQNSEVNIADITPVFINFGSTDEGANWENAHVADGDTNGMVNIADIAVIEMNFYNMVYGYNIYTSPSIDDLPSGPGEPNGPGALLVGNVSFWYEYLPTGFKTFSYTLETPVDQNWYWVRPDTDQDQLDLASNFVMYENPQ